MTSPTLASPIPLSDLEAVLAWVDTFKLSKPTKKINRDFSDAVLLAEILAVHYPKLVEMHNYPPRNSHSLKLNNWMTLNRKVLKRLKLNLCTTTMEQLANSAPGIIERVLIMVRDKIKRDEELEKSTKEPDQNQSSGGSYYEACGDEEGVLVVPVKTRVNGVLETIQQKVVSFETYSVIKEELKDARDTAAILKQKVEHLDSLLKLKDERINELQKQLDRKQARRKEIDNLQNTIQVPFEEPPSPVIGDLKKSSGNLAPGKTEDEAKFNIIVMKPIEESNEIPRSISVTPKISTTNIPSIHETDLKDKLLEPEVERIRSDVFKEATDAVLFNDTKNNNTIEATIMKELDAITWPEKNITDNPQIS